VYPGSAAAGAGTRGYGERVADGEDRGRSGGRAGRETAALGAAAGRSGGGREGSGGAGLGRQLEGAIGAEVGGEGEVGEVGELGGVAADNRALGFGEQRVGVGEL
jgi:hypothetical protein